LETSTSSLPSSTLTSPQRTKSSRGDDAGGLREAADVEASKIDGTGGPQQMQSGYRERTP
jgi:hypothetical protein